MPSEDHEPYSALPTGADATGDASAPDAQQSAGGSPTHFGFREVDETVKAGLVGEVFSSVASRYDLMNDLMSFGVHRYWKQVMVEWLRPTPGMHVLDVGGGTGDIAIRILKAGGGAVSVVDINRVMLSVGRDRALDAGRVRNLDWICGDAECLPIASSSVDAYTIAFCIRNVTRISAALAEARRVLKPGGRFLCLEFSRVALPVLDGLYDAYSFRVLPRLGQAVAGNAEAYRYLVESIRRFPPQEAFARMIGDAGLDLVRFRNLSGGIAALHSAWRT